MAAKSFMAAAGKYQSVKPGCNTVKASGSTARGPSVAAEVIRPLTLEPIVCIYKTVAGSFRTGAGKERNLRAKGTAFGSGAENTKPGAEVGVGVGPNTAAPAVAAHRGGIGG